MKKALNKNETINNGLNLNLSDGGYIFSLTAAISFAVSLIFSFVVVWISASTNQTVESITDNNIVKIVSFALGSFGVAASLLIFSLKKKINPILLLKQEKTNNKTVVWVASLLITVGVIFGLSELNVWFSEFLSGLGLSVSEVKIPEKSPLFVILTLIFVCVIPAIVEESLFRGVMLSALKEKGEIFAVLMSGALFSLFHMQPVQTLYQFVFGVLFAFISIRYGGILPVMVCHFINNAYVILNYYFFGISFTGGVKITVTVIALILLGIGLFILFRFTERRSDVPSKTKSVSVKPFFLSGVIGFIICLSMWFTNLV